MTTTETEPLALISADIEKVLGEYDHELPFPQGEGFVIIYGPNGVGKTKFLEILHAASDLNLRDLANLPFKKATLQFSDGSVLRISKLSSEPPGEESDSAPRDLEILLEATGKKPVQYFYTRTKVEKWLISNTSYSPSNGDLWVDKSDGEVVSLRDLELRYGLSSDRSAQRKMPEELTNFKTKIPSFLIETQRLRTEQRQYTDRELRVSDWEIYPTRRRKLPVSSKISQQAEKMRSLINEAQTEHSKITQQLDRTFPNRVLEGSLNTPVDDTEVRNRYNEQNAFRSRLGPVAAVALEDALSLPERQLLEWQRQLLNLYLDDADKKLAPFETLLQKIELLENIINSRLLKKRIQVTASEGLKVVHEVSGSSINLDSLSSGEQHEIILMFDLLFNVSKGALVMIDEPEISLHVVWQLAFIPDVQRIAKLAGFRFIVATHSPQIINDMWEQSVRLGPSEAPFS